LFIIDPPESNPAVIYRNIAQYVIDVNYSSNNIKKVSDVDSSSIIFKLPLDNVLASIIDFCERKLRNPDFHYQIIHKEGENTVHSSSILI